MPIIYIPSNESSTLSSIQDALINTPVGACVIHDGTFSPDCLDDAQQSTIIVDMGANLSLVEDDDTSVASLVSDIAWRIDALGEENTIIIMARRSVLQRLTRLRCTS